MANDIEKTIEQLRRIQKILEEMAQKPKNKNLSLNTNKAKTNVVRSINTWEDLLTPPEWRDFYHALTSHQKKVYDAILDGIVNYKEYVTVKNLMLSKDQVGEVYHYILWDNPAIFCIGEYAMYDAVTEGSNRIQITSLCKPKENEQALRKQVVNSVKNFLKKPGLATMSELQRERYVHDYIIENCIYDFTYGSNYARLEPFTVYGTLVQKSAVCEGIAKTTKLLLEVLSVRSQVVTGALKNDSGYGHGWNTVKIDGKAYHLDVNHDMNYLPDGTVKPKYEYFNVDDDFMARKRTWMNQHIIWKCKGK